MKWKLFVANEIVHLKKVHLAANLMVIFTKDFQFHPIPLTSDFQIILNNFWWMRWNLSEL